MAPSTTTNAQPCTSPSATSVVSAAARAKAMAATRPWRRVRSAKAPPHKTPTALHSRKAVSAVFAQARVRPWPWTWPWVRAWAWIRAHAR